MLNVMTLVKYGHSIFLPCGCGMHFDWYAGWQEVPLYAAAHQSVLAWTAVESLTPALQSYSFPGKIY